MAFYNFAPEFADIEHLHPALAVVEPYVNRPDGSVLQLEYREGECIPYAVARYHLPDAALNGVILHGSPADDVQLDERDTLCPQCGKAECSCQSDWANSINERRDNVRRCAMDCGMPAEPGDIYCAPCRSGVRS